MGTGATEEDGNRGRGETEETRGNRGTRGKGATGATREKGE